MISENNNNNLGRSKMLSQSPKTIFIVFVALLLDLLAFTMILPLFPSLLEHYRLQPNDWLYSVLSKHLEWYQSIIGSPERYNSVLFGGVLGSMFSFLQFVGSPFFGALSDHYGRKPVLVLCMIGITISHVLWAISSNMLLFVFARFVGGLFKGNVSLSMAIIADVSDRKTRGHGMALVGIAFSLGFILGPIIGAAFAQWAHRQTGQWYIYPACFACALSAIDLLFVVIAFKETLPKKKRTKVFTKSVSDALALIDIRQLFKFKAVRGLSPQELDELTTLGRIYFVYLFIYSGLEFTLTFLTHHVFGYTSMKQGWMFFGIGVTMALIQGGYVRRLSEHQVGKAAVVGLWILIPTFVCIGVSPLTNILFLYVGVFLYAVSTAFVVSCLTAIASNYGGSTQKGVVMGIFRSLGSLARAIGPIVASISFWCIGSTATYLIGAFALMWPAFRLLATHKSMTGSKKQ